MRYTSRFATTLLIVGFLCNLLWQFADAAYRCERACVKWSGRRVDDGRLGFCPNFNWNSCPVTQSPDRSDWMAKAIYEDTIKQMGTAGSQMCNETLTRFACFMVFPVCESGTHSMKLCDGKNDKLLNTLKEACQDTNSSSALENLVSRARKTHTLSTQTSCFPFNYRGPSEYVYWYVGFLLCTIFSALSSVAFNLQKMSINENDLSDHPRPVYLQWKWVLGLVLLITGSLVDFVAYGLAPQSLLTPLAALVLVWNILVAKCFGEQPGRREIVSVFIIFSGTTLTVAFADHYTPSYSMEDVRKLYHAPRMVAYSFFVPLIIGAHLYALRYIRKHNVINDNALSEKSRMFYSRIECACYAGTAGIVGGHAILFAKQAMELMKSWGAGDNVWVYYEMYLIIIGVIVGLFGNVSFLNTALRYYDALQVIPIYQTYWIIFGTASGLVFFDEIGEMTSVQILFFLLGCIISLSGVLVLSLRPTVRINTRAAGDENTGAQVENSHKRAEDTHGTPGSRRDESDEEEDQKSLLLNTSIDSMDDRGIIVDDDGPETAHNAGQIEIQLSG